MTTPLALGEERLEENEVSLINQIKDIILARMKATYPPDKLSKRDAHPKTHGMVRAKFVVPENLPENVRHGLFARPGSYDCLARYSASLQQVTPDIVMQPQGLSFKVFGVDGEKLLPSEKDARTQDFVMINHPSFFIRDLPTYVEFNNAQSNNTLLEFAAGHPDELAVLMRMVAERVFNPMMVQYWSQTPYKLGPHAIKYSVKPVNGSDPRPDSMSLDFMRDLMVESIGKAPLQLEFLVQVQTDPVKMPVEDPIVEWKEDEAPPVRVATIEIPQQDISSGKDLEVAEGLAFTVWHSLPEHRPIGSMNRCRKLVYEMGSRLRQSQNGVPHGELEQIPEF